MSVSSVPRPLGFAMNMSAMLAIMASRACMLSTSRSSVGSGTIRLRWPNAASGQGFRDITEKPLTGCNPYCASIKIGTADQDPQRCQTAIRAGTRCDRPRGVGLASTPAMQVAAGATIALLRARDCLSAGTQASAGCRGLRCGIADVVRRPLRLLRPLGVLSRPRYRNWLNVKRLVLLGGDLLVKYAVIARLTRRSMTPVSDSIGSSISSASEVHLDGYRNALSWPRTSANARSNRRVISKCVPRVAVNLLLATSPGNTFIAGERMKPAAINPRSRQEKAGIRRYG